jgi:hypothetical protein
MQDVEYFEKILNGRAEFRDVASLDTHTIEALDEALVRFARAKVNRPITPICADGIDHDVHRRFWQIPLKCIRFCALMGIYFDELHRADYLYFGRSVCDLRKKYRGVAAPHPLDVFLPPLCVARARLFMENCKCCR